MDGNETEMAALSAIANQHYPRLTPYAPNVISQAMPSISHAAGMFDPASRSVVINSAYQNPLNQRQAAGLVSLERARGMLASPLGRQFTDNFPMSPQQSAWWNKFYLPPSVNAPQGQAARDAILKSTILSRMLVGDTMPQGAPPITSQQQDMGNLFSSYASMGKR